MGENHLYLNFEIGCEPFIVLHVQLMKRAAASFILSSFGVMMDIQLATLAVLSYLRIVFNPSYLHTSREMLLELSAERTEEKF
jgi:hypothetical protein